MKAHMLTNIYAEKNSRIFCHVSLVNTQRLEQLRQKNNTHILKKVIFNNNNELILCPEYYFFL